MPRRSWPGTGTLSVFDAGRVRPRWYHAFRTLLFDTGDRWNTHGIRRGSSSCQPLDRGAARRGLLVLPALSRPRTGAALLAFSADCMACASVAGPPPRCRRPMHQLDLNGTAWSGLYERPGGLQPLPPRVGGILLAGDIDAAAERALVSASR
jgi:hypothetical protein